MSWLDRALENFSPSRSVAPRHLAETMAAHPDPFRRYWRGAQPQNRQLIYAGRGPQGFCFAPPGTNLLAIAPSRAEPGKSSSVVAPNCYLWQGPLFLVSNKIDAYESTALVRSALGQVWHFAPDGRKALPGARPLRFSFVRACAGDFAAAVTITDQMTGAATSTSNDSSNAEHFKQNASRLLAALFAAAYWLDEDTRWVFRAVVLGTSVPGAQMMSAAIAACQAANRPAIADELNSVDGMNPREKASTYSSARNALRAYQTEGALQSADNHNFDADAFVAGAPDLGNPELMFKDHNEEFSFGKNSLALGQYDSIYVTTGDESHAPLVIGFLTYVRMRAHARSQDFRRGQSSKVLFALDEMGTFAPVPSLPNWLAEGNTGAAWLGVLQSMDQAFESWGDNKARGMISSGFQNKLIFPGVFDKRLIEILTYFSPKYEHRKIQDGVSQGWQQQGWFGGNNSDGTNQTVSYEQRPVVTPDALVQRMPGQMHSWFYATGNAVPGPVTMTPYFSASPWVTALLKESIRVVQSFNQGFGRRRFPLPPFEYDGIYASLTPNNLAIYKQLRGEW